MHETRWKHVRKFSLALLLPWNWQGTEWADPHLLSLSRIVLGGKQSWEKRSFHLQGIAVVLFSSPPGRHLLGGLGRTETQSPEMLNGGPSRKSEQGLGLFGLCVLSVVESQTR